VFGLVYAAFAQRRGLVVSLTSALAVWIAVAIALRAIEWTLLRALLLNAATYAVMTSMALILQPRVGGAVAAAVIANGLTGLVGFGASLVVLHLAALHLGNAAALTLWLLASMGWNLCLWALWRRRMEVRPSSPPRP
jgi:hypothetical protein